MKTVVHLVSGDEAEHRTALAIVENLLDDETGSIDAVAIVVQAGGIDAVTTEGEHGDQVRSLLDRGVSFAACENTLDTNGLDESDLIEGVEAVPEGAVGVTRRSAIGWPPHGRRYRHAFSPSRSTPGSASNVSRITPSHHACGES